MLDGLEDKEGDLLGEEGERRQRAKKGMEHQEEEVVGDTHTHTYRHKDQSCTSRGVHLGNEGDEEEEEEEEEEKEEEDEEEAAEEIVLENANHSNFQQLPMSNQTFVSGCGRLDLRLSSNVLTRRVCVRKEDLHRLINRA